MANPHRGEVPFDLDGKSYKLAYSINALCELEDQMGKSVVEIADLLSKPERLHVSAVRTLFWAGLLDNHPGVTPEEAGNIMTGLGIVPALGLVAKTFVLAFPQMAADQDPLVSAGRRPRIGNGKRC
jgi:hypothetical protein